MTQSSTPILFGTDGIRGIAGQYPFQKAFLKRLGAAAARVFCQHVSQGASVFLLGRDTRQSGPWIAEAFAKGAAAYDITLTDLGIISTPSLAYLVPYHQVYGGVMISASHNPAQFNGIKLFGPNGRKCPDAWERAIEREIAQDTKVGQAHSSMQKDKRAIPAYLDYLESTVQQKEPLKGLTIVVDCANGSLSKIAPAFLRRLGARVIAIGISPNGKNINAGWGSQHPEKMQRLVLQKHADGGVAFDGDGDRAILCDERGRLLDGDFILACASHCLKEENRLKNNTVVLTVMANLGLIKALQSHRIQTLTTPVGDRYVSDVLEEHDGILGGEQSGHIIFREFLPTGDGLLTAIQLMSMLRRRQRPFSWAYSLFERYPQVLLNVEVKHKKPLEECPEVQGEIQKAREELGDQGRVVVRYSGTEPLLRIMMEGPDKTRLEVLADQIAGQARRVLGSVI